MMEGVKSFWDLETEISKKMFLTILSFIPLRRLDYRDLLILMRGFATEMYMNLIQIKKF